MSMTASRTLSTTGPRTRRPSDRVVRAAWGSRGRLTACLSVSLLSLLGPGCGGEPGAPVGEAQQPIIGGVATTGDPAVVALYGIAPGADKGALCTATIISPTVVLTAAHCVDPSIVGTGLVYSVLTGSDLNDKAHPSPKLAVKETHFDPLFDHNNILNGHDIAVAILASPTTITPLPWNADAIAPALKGQPARIVGYGLNDGFGQKGAGLKRVATVKLNDFDELLVKTGDLGHTICSGDSGGPVLMKVGGVEKVVGVNSFGIIFCLFSGNSTRVDKYASFIKSFLK